MKKRIDAYVFEAKDTETRFVFRAWAAASGMFFGAAVVLVIAGVFFAAAVEEGLSPAALPAFLAGVAILAGGGYWVLAPRYGIRIRLDRASGRIGVIAPFRFFSTQSDDIESVVMWAIPGGRGACTIRLRTKSRGLVNLRLNFDLGLTATEAVELLHPVATALAEGLGKPLEIAEVTTDETEARRRRRLKQAEAGGPSPEDIEANRARLETAGEYAGCEVREAPDSLVAVIPAKSNSKPLSRFLFGVAVIVVMAAIIWFESEDPPGAGLYLFALVFLGGLTFQYRRESRRNARKVLTVDQRAQTLSLRRSPADVRVVDTAAITAVIVDTVKIGSGWHGVVSFRVKGRERLYFPLDAGPLSSPEEALEAFWPLAETFARFLGVELEEYSISRTSGSPSNPPLPE